MLGYLVFAVALLGSSLAAYWDVMTTEVPDSLSYLVAGAAVAFHIFAALDGGEWWLVGYSVMTGCGLFAFGWLLYLAGMWGGADAFVLGAVGFSLPLAVTTVDPAVRAAWPIGVSYLVNVFLVGMVYTVVFAVITGVRDRSTMQKFYNELLENIKRFLILLGGFVVIAFGMMIWAGTLSVAKVVTVAHGTVLLLSFLILYRFLVVVEDAVMVEECDVEDLEVGDVLAEDVVVGDEVIDSSKIVGIEKEQLAAIRKSRDSVLLKHGVMFVPAFPVALLATVTVGDLVVWLVRGLL